VRVLIGFYFSVATGPGGGRWKKNFGVVGLQACYIIIVPLIYQGQEEIQLMSTGGVSQINIQVH
jgi:hypothetical protein